MVKDELAKNNEGLLIEKLREAYIDTTVHQLLRRFRFILRHRKKICKSKYSKWSDKQIRANLMILYTHNCILFFTHKIFDADSYNGLYK